MNVKYFFMPFPVLDLGDIILREITYEDAIFYYQYMNRQEMNAYLTADNQPQNIENAEEELLYWSSLFPSKKSIYWGIALKNSNKLIGTAGFNVISFANDRAEMSYDLDPDYWGQGVMRRAIKAILKFADHKLGIVRIQATVIIDNDRSIRLLDKCGFTREGFMPKYEVVEGVHKDYYMYGRTKS